MSDSFEIEIKKNALNNHEKNGVESSKDKSPNLLLQGKINSSSGPNIEGIEQEYEAAQQAFDKATQSHEKEQTDIQNQITSFETEKGSLESSISAKNGIIQNLSSQIQSFGNPTAPNQADYAVVTEEGEGEDKKQVTSYPGYAEALAEYNNKMNQLNQLKAQLQQAQNEKNALDAKVANIDAKISGLNTKSSQSSTEVQMAQTKVNSVKAKLDAAKIQQQQAQMNAINEQNLSLTQNNSENNENITTYENNNKDNKEISKDEISNQLNVLTNFNKNNLNININEIKDKLTKQNALGEIKALKDRVENKILDFQSNSNEITKKLLIGFSANIQQQIKTLENKINIIENEPDKEQIPEEQENTQEECLTDPIGIEKDGVTYDFIKYDGDFDSISDFLGSSDKGIGELIALDADKSGAVSGDELANSGIMVVRREGNKQTLVPISEVQKELGGKLSINLAGINAEAKEDQNFDVNIEKADGTTEKYNGYSTYKDNQYFKDTYDFSIDNEKANVQDSLDVGEKITEEVLSPSNVENKENENSPKDEEIDIPLITTEEYKNVYGKDCTATYECSTEYPYSITATYQEGDSVKSFNFFSGIQQDGQKCFCIINGDEIITESVDDFSRRIYMMQNYASKLPDGFLTTDQIQKFQTITTSSEQTNCTRESFESERSKDGVLGDIHNILKCVINSDLSSSHINHEIKMLEYGENILQKAASGTLDRSELHTYLISKLSEDINFYENVRFDRFKELAYCGGVVPPEVQERDPLYKDLDYKFFYNMLDYIPCEVLMDWASNGIPNKLSLSSDVVDKKLTGFTVSGIRNGEPYEYRVDDISLLPDSQEKVDYFEDVYKIVYGTEYNYENYNQFEQACIALKDCDPNSEEYSTCLKDYLDAYSKTYGLSKDVRELIELYAKDQAAAVERIKSIGTTAAVAFALAVAPVTGGASIALAAGVGATTKVALGGVDALTAGREYSANEILKDGLGGGFQGALMGASFLASKGLDKIVLPKFAQALSKSGPVINNLLRVGYGAGKGGSIGAGYSSLSSSFEYALDCAIYGKDFSIDEYLKVVGESTKYGAALGSIFGAVGEYSAMKANSTNYSPKGKLYANTVDESGNITGSVYISPDGSQADLYVGPNHPMYPSELVNSKTCPIVKYSFANDSVTMSAINTQWNCIEVNLGTVSFETTLPSIVNTTSYAGLTPASSETSEIILPTENNALSIPENNIPTNTPNLPAAQDSSVGISTSVGMSTTGTNEVQTTGYTRPYSATVSSMGDFKIPSTAQQMTANSTTKTGSVLSEDEAKAVIKARLQEAGYTEYGDEDIHDLYRVIDTTLKRLDKNGIKMTVQDMMDIIEATNILGDNDVSRLVTLVTSQTSYGESAPFKALVLSQLKNAGILTDKIIQDITNNSPNLGFQQLFSKNLAFGDDYFELTLKECGYSDEVASFLNNMASKIADGELALEDVKSLIPDFTKITDDDVKNFNDNLIRSKGYKAAGKFGLQDQSLSSEELKFLSDISDSFDSNKYGLSETEYGEKYLYFKNITNGLATIEDIDFLIQNAEKNPYYTPDEYAEAFMYFKNLKTKDGIGIFDMGELNEKLQKYGMGDIAGEIENPIYSNIKALLEINPASPEASDMQMLIELVQEGFVNPSAFRKLEDLSTLKDVASLLLGTEDDQAIQNGGKWSLSPEVKQDLELLYNVIANNRDKGNLTAELEEAYTPTVKSEQDGLSRANIGDAFQVEGEEFIRIKTGEDTSELMNISKETYYKLFPPVERFASSQQIMGDCYCIETLMALFGDETQRANIVRLFSESNNGQDISIKMPNGDVEEISLKDMALPADEDEAVYSSGALGYKMLEYAYSVNRIHEINNEAIETLTGEQAAELAAFEAEHGFLDTFIYKDENGNYKWTTYKEAVEQGLINNYNNMLMDSQAYNSFNQLLLGNGGVQYTVLDKLGYDSKVYIPAKIYDYETAKQQFIENAQKFGVPEEDALESFANIYGDSEETYNTAILELNKIAYDQFTSMGIPKTSIEVGTDILSDLKNPDFYNDNIVNIGMSMHAYSLTCKVDSDGNVAYYLYNPHQQGLPILITDIDAFLTKENLIQTITVSSKKEVQCNIYENAAENSTESVKAGIEPKDTGVLKVDSDAEVTRYEDNNTSLQEKSNTSAEKFEINDQFCIDTIKEIEGIDFELSDGTKMKVKNSITDYNELKDALEKMSTPYDTEEIVRERAKSLVAGQLYTNKGSRSFLEKDPQIQGILSDASDGISNANKGKTITIITGRPASGKSTYIEQNGLNSENGYFLVDSDAIKEKLPGYEQYGANYVHGISASIARAEIEAAIEEGADIVYPTTSDGKSIIELAKGNGYTVRIIYCDVPEAECVERSMNRFHENGRFVDPYHIINSKSFEQVNQTAQNYDIVVEIVK